VFCDYDNLPPSGKVCDFDVKSLGPCSLENNYNYHRSSPCVLLSLSKSADWQPKFYNSSKLPEKMPEKLKAVIANQVASAPKKEKTIWVDCVGENPADVENIGPVAYFPTQGFPGYSLDNKSEDEEAVVAVQFQKPQLGVVVVVKCQVWAENSDASVTFELLID